MELVPARIWEHKKALSRGKNHEARCGHVEKEEHSVGDFNGPSWRAAQDLISSTLEEAFKNAKLPVLPGPATFVAARRGSR